MMIVDVGKRVLRARRINFLALFIAPLILMSFPVNSFAVEGEVSGCGCYCGAVIPPPCSEEACKSACGWQGSSPSAPSGPSQEEIERQREEQERISLSPRQHFRPRTRATTQETYL